MVEPVSEGKARSPLTPCLETRNNPCGGMDHFSSPVLSLARPQRLLSRTSISEVYPWRSQTWKGVSDAEVSAKPRSCLATPPEVTTVVAEERRTRSCGLWCRRREDAPAREVKARRASGAVLPRRRRRPEWAGGQSPRKRRRGQNGCGSLAWVSDEPWDSVGPGLVLPSASNVRLSGNDTRLGPCPWLLDVPGRCAGERGLGLSCVTHRPRGGR